MPRLTEYINVGFCSGYGDGDWRVSMKVESLSRNAMNELCVAMFHAQRNAWDIWAAAQVKEQAKQDATAGATERGGQGR